MNMKQKILFLYRLKQKISSKLGINYRTVIHPINAYKITVNSNPETDIDKSLSKFFQYISHMNIPRVLCSSVFCKIKREKINNNPSRRRR